MAEILVILCTTNSTLACFLVFNSFEAEIKTAALRMNTSEMCNLQVFFIFLVSSWIVTAQNLPDVKPIIHMIPHCPTSKLENTLVQMKADVPVVAEVHCRYGRMFNMKRVDEVTYAIEATFSDENDTSVCAFQKKSDADVFVLPVNVLWGDGKGEVLKFWHRTILTCGFDPHGSDSSNVQQMTEDTLPLKENQRNKGPLSDAKFEVLLLDVLGKAVDGLPVGRKTQLKAVMTGAKGNVGFRVTSCNAIATGGDTNNTYGIIRGGCGDGKVFTKSAGFLTNGVVAHSPYFPAFRLMGSNLLTFECNFTLCHSNCDGNSCDIESGDRRRRSVRSVENRLEAASEYIADSDMVDEPVYTARSSIVINGDDDADQVQPKPNFFTSIRKMRRQH